MKGQLEDEHHRRRRVMEVAQKEYNLRLMKEKKDND